MYIIKVLPLIAKNKVSDRFNEVQGLNSVFVFAFVFCFFVLFSLQVRKHINDLYEDLRDGHNLITLLEVLSGDTLVSSRDVLFQGFAEI